MELTPLYKWILNHGFYAGQVMLVISAALMVNKNRRALEIFCLTGFICFLVGSLIMLETRSEILSIGDVRIGSDTNRDLWGFGRAMSSLGFLAGSASLLFRNFLRR